MVYFMDVGYPKRVLSDHKQTFGAVSAIESQFLGQTQPMKG